MSDTARNKTEEGIFRTGKGIPCPFFFYKRVFKGGKTMKGKMAKGNIIKGKKKNEHVIAGVLSKNKRGFGFVRPSDSGKTGGKDIFIPPGCLRDAMNGDTVSVRLGARPIADEKSEGKIIKVLTRATDEFVGTFHKTGNWGYVSPETKKEGEDIHIGRNDINNAKDGDKVVVKITAWPEAHHDAQGRIKEIISKNGELGGDVKALIRSYQIEEEFPPEAAEEASNVTQKVRDEDLKGRMDLREKTIFTIDGADAKDFDDAVSIDVLPDGKMRLGVHIADVCHYVKENGPIDKEAFRRGTSVYLADRVIPMLPFALSDGICSLRPGEDRLTLSVFMEIDKNGEVTDHEITESVIRSKERLVYTDISDLLENDDAEQKLRYAAILPDLLQMKELASALQRKRKKRGSLDFDFDEAHLTLNSDGLPVSVEIAERRMANKVIEEFMLIANETIAEHYNKMQLPFVYRVHDNPDPDKMEEFRGFLQSMGLTLTGKPGNVQPKALNAILAQVAGTQAETVINTVMLRSMKKAAYNAECLGHFGLGAEYYCHFTSPIRRYPDQMIHRIIKASIHGAIDEKRKKAFKLKTEETALAASIAERKAEDLEREVEKLKKAEYMESRLDEEFDGIISGIISGGFFVQLANTIEGMVRMDSLTDDQYTYEADKYRMIGKKNKKIYGLGKAVRVRVASVDTTAREIRFELIGV